MSGQVEATANLAPCPHCGEPHGEDQLRCPKTDMLLPFEGRRLDGKFRFLSSLGSGGMASVWLARNERVDREVAIKFLRPEVGRDPEAVARFRSEARAAGRIGNKHICEVLDFGDSPIGPYMVMERLRGLDLAALIRRQGRLQPGNAVRIVRHALEGLAAAHAAGIIHRDLKPGNVFLHRTDDGDTQVKLMDFGVSKFLDGSGDAQTLSGILLGTPEYMAPEQLEGANKLGPASDIFAMGAILYRSITGQQVFSGANLVAVLRAMAVDKPTPVDQLVEGLPAELVAIIHRCLERDPAARFASAAELSDALAPFEQLEGAVRVLDVPSRISPAAQAAADSSFNGPSRPVETDELLPSAIVVLESEPAEPIESATRVWQQDAIGPLRDRDSSTLARPNPAEPTPAAAAGKTDKPIARRRALGLLVGGLVLAVLVFVGRDWLGGLFGPSDSPSVITNAVTSSPEAEALATPGSETGMTSSETGSPTETGATETSATETDSDSTETDSTDSDSTDSGEPSSDSPGFSTNRPAPPGTFRAGGFITPNEPGPLGDQRSASKACEDLAARRFASVGKWRLASPGEAGTFIHSKIKSSRYWTTAIWRGKARVYTLPKGKKDSEMIDRKIARPLCVSRW